MKWTLQTSPHESTRTLSALLHRPAVVRVPAVALRTAVREVSSERLGSDRVEPKRLQDEGFTFEHPTLEARLVSALGH